MSLTQIVYASRPFGFDASVLDDILTISRARNSRNAITGTLICRADMYLQLIEGPDASIQATYARIAADADRHDDVTPLVTRTVADRLFPQWAMRDDPPRSWMWTPEQVAAGAIHAATTADIVAIFERLASEPAEDLPARHT
jgi:Sensors of blue-light using FAD